MSDAKAIVEQAYDSLADWYLTWIDDQNSPRERYASKVLENLPPSSTTTNPYILELGCGPGVPITRLLLNHGARVLANDISQKQITLAKAKCLLPNTATNTIEFIASDMTTLSISPSTLDGVVCFFTLFHLPRSEQKSMLAKILAWLKPGGLLVINFATVDEEAIYGEMMGHGIFWSSFPVEENRAMVEGVGLEVECEEVLASEADGGVEFQWVAARKRREEV